MMRLPKKLEYQSVGSQKSTLHKSYETYQQMSNSMTSTPPLPPTSAATPPFSRQRRSGSGSHLDPSGQGLGSPSMAPVFKLALEKDDRINKLANIAQSMHSYIFKKFKHQHEKFLILCSYETVRQLKEIQDLYESYIRLKYKILSCCCDHTPDHDYDKICSIMIGGNATKEYINMNTKIFASYSSAELNSVSDTIDEIKKDMDILKIKFKEVRLRFSISDEVLNARKQSLLVTIPPTPATNASPPILPHGLSNFRLE